MTAESQNFAPSTAERFAETVAGIINQGAVAVSLSLGHRTGLFDTMAGMAPAGSVEIAAAADLAERYVREWLAVMVTGGVIDYDPETSRYHLPSERAACLTRGAALGNLAIYAQHVALTSGRRRSCRPRSFAGPGSRHNPVFAGGRSEHRGV
ncbi:hypothetical protein [Sediminimonas qiaohouensis]|uniref:hypothetical protein n=1 Tax=Sediminimonas qiaohouensis TaxID=552061 RepID=UPI002353B975|nr:hypothetical protein [Sediminimonas qiaohouensis]